MTATKFATLLDDLSACSEARKWAKGKSLAQAWKTSHRGDWMLWLVARMIGKRGWPTHQEAVLAACACAEPVLKYVSQGEERPRIAIETARKWARGEATIEEVRTAARGARACYDAAYTAATTYAAYTAATAAYTAYTAATARSISLQSSADIVRSMLHPPTTTTITKKRSAK